MALALEGVDGGPVPPSATDKRQVGPLSPSAPKLFVALALVFPLLFISFVLHVVVGAPCKWHQQEASAHIVHPFKMGAAQMSTRLAGGCAKGELTLLGQQQALEMGRWLRRRYIEDASFLPASHQVHATSATASCQLPASFTPAACRQRHQQHRRAQQQQHMHLGWAAGRSTCFGCHTPCHNAWT